MSRHRNVRSMNYTDEYDGYDDVYGHSVEDDYTISPSDAAFMYDRNSRQPQMSIYLKGEEDIAEEDEQIYKDELSDDVDKDRVAICLEEVRNVMGNSFPEQVLINTIIEKNYDTAAVVDVLLNKAPFTKKEIAGSPKPQRLTSLRGVPRKVKKRNPAKHTTDKLPRDVTPSLIYGNMNVDHCLFEKYKKFEIDFSQILIKNIDENLKNDKGDTVEMIDTIVPNIIKQNDYDKYGHPLYTSNLSKVGYYLCMKYIEIPVKLKIHHEIQTNIKPFKFDTRSPDEVTKKAFVVIKKAEHKLKF